MNTHSSQFCYQRQKKEIKFKKKAWGNEENSSAPSKVSGLRKATISLWLYFITYNGCKKIIKKKKVLLTDMFLDWSVQIWQKQ